MQGSGISLRRCSRGGSRRGTPPRFSAASRRYRTPTYRVTIPNVRERRVTEAHPAARIISPKAEGSGKARTDSGRDAYADPREKIPPIRGRTLLKENRYKGPK